MRWSVRRTEDENLTDRKQTPVDVDAAPLKFAEGDPDDNRCWQGLSRFAMLDCASQIPQDCLDPPPKLVARVHDSGVIAES
jgi:hypothetical protein